MLTIAVSGGAALICVDVVLSAVINNGGQSSEVRLCPVRGCGRGFPL